MMSFFEALLSSGRSFHTQQCFSQRFDVAFVSILSVFKSPDTPTLLIVRLVFSYECLCQPSDRQMTTKKERTGAEWGELLLCWTVTV